MLRTSLLLMLVGVLFSDPSLVFAGNQFFPIVPIPGIDYNNVDGEKLIEVLYILAISFAALLAVGQLVIAGFQYITSEIVTNKEEAKKRIRAAVVGLLIILAAVAILRAINPDIGNLPSLSTPPRPEVTRPHAETVRPGDSTAGEIQDQLSQCSNIILYNDNTRCCNDGGSCDPPPPTSSTLSGLSENKNVYTAEEIMDIVEQNGGEDRVVDLGPSLQGFSDEQLEQQCEMAAESREKELAEVVTLHQVIVSNGIRNIAERTLCVMQTNGAGTSGSNSAQVDQPDDLPADAEAFMVGEEIYFTDHRDDDSDTDALYCEADNDPCNSYCFENDGVMDEQTGICYVPVQPLQLNVSG